MTMIDHLLKWVLWALPQASLAKLEMGMRCFRMAVVTVGAFLFLSSTAAMGKSGGDAASGNIGELQAGPTKVLPGEKTVNEVRRDDYEANEKPGLDRAITYLTAAIASASFLQLALFFWQLRLMRESLADTKISADAAKESALAARHSAEILVKQNMPLIHFIEFHSTGPNIVVTCSNIGKTAAVVIESCIEYTDEKDIPECPVYTHIRPETEPIVPDGRFSFPSIIAAPFISVAKSEQRKNGEVVPCVYGYIRYRDNEGVIFDVGFCWRMNQLGLPMQAPPNYVYQRRV